MTAPPGKEGAAPETAPPLFASGAESRTGPSSAPQGARVLEHAHPVRVERSQDTGFNATFAAGPSTSLGTNGAGVAAG